MKNQAKRYMEVLLRQWYGKETGRGEMTRYMARPMTLSETLDKLSHHLIPPWEMRVIQLKEAWEQIAGPDTARRCRVSHLNEGILYIEVMHMAYRTILETPRIKANLLEKVQAFIGAEHCSRIKFIAGGRSMLPPKRVP